MPAVARSLEEAGNELLTFYVVPQVGCGRSLRTTNPLENLQSGVPSSDEDAGIVRD